MTFGRTSTILRLLFSAAFLFALTACGDTPDEESPLLRLEAVPTLVADLGTDNPPLAISGTVEPGADVKVEKDPKTDEEIKVEPTEIGWTADAPLRPGTNTFIVTATDDRGNTSIIRRTLIYERKIQSYSPLSNGLIEPPTDIKVTFASPTAPLPEDVAMVVSSGGTAVKGNPTAGPPDFSWKPESSLDKNKIYDVTLTVKYTENGEKQPATTYQWSFKTLP